MKKEKKKVLRLLKYLLEVCECDVPITTLINSFFKSKLYKKDIKYVSISLKWNNVIDRGESHKVVDFYNPNASSEFTVIYQRYMLNSWYHNLQVAVALQIHEDNAMWLYYPCGDVWHKVLL